jgi:hypothetical protein
VRDRLIDAVRLLRNDEFGGPTGKQPVLDIRGHPKARCGVTHKSRYKNDWLPLASQTRCSIRDTWSAATGLKWPELLAHLRATGKAMPIKDSLIAATALTHYLSVATGNR